MRPDAGTLHRMQVAQEANALAYRRAAQTSAPGDCWDFVVLTAANEKQAQGYAQELLLRHRSVGPTGAFFPPIQRSIVVPDPPGRRAGSGGATLGVLKQLAQRHGLARADFARLRILLIHSGGASQRLPAYSPLGKIFAPLPLLRPDGQISTLFDHLYITLAGLPERLGPGMLVLAGDVFLLLDHRHVTAPPRGVTALTMRVDAELGRGHGVFAVDARGAVRQTLQKVSVEQMRQAGAADEHGRILIDTGLLFFDPPCCARLADLAGAQGGKGLQDRSARPIDLYDDMTGALASGASRADYLKADGSPVRRAIWDALHGVPFRVMELEGQFLHLGTTRQFRDAMVGHNPEPAAELFQQDVLTHSEWPLEPGQRVYHSALLAEGANVGAIGPGSVVEHSVLSGACRIGAGCVVSQVLALRRPIVLPDNMLLFQVPVREAGRPVRYVNVLCGVEDDFKGRHGEGRCIYLNRPIEQFLQRHRISERDLWKDVPQPMRTLWTARLFAATADRDAADSALWLASTATAPSAVVAAWRKAPRYSMAMLLEQADPVALIEHREVVSAFLQTAGVVAAIRRGDDHPLEPLVGHYTTTAAYLAAAGQLEAYASRPVDRPASALRQARALWCAGQLMQRPDQPDPAAAYAQAERLMAAAFEIGRAHV